MAADLLQGEAENVESAPRVSLAIPVFNEEPVVGNLLQRTLSVLDALPGGPHEVVFVDDGSCDETFEILSRAATSDPRIVAVSLSRNFGHQAAIFAALDYVSGEAVVVMDGDLQDPPEEIPRFLEEYAKGYDVVYAIRVSRKENVGMRLLYRLFYRVIALLSDVDLPLGAGDFALLSRRVVDLMRRSAERNRYLRGLRTWVGFRQIGVPVERSARHAGKSKYTLAKLLRLAFNGIFAYSVVPLRIAAFVGGLAVCVSVLFGLYALYAKVFLDQSPQGFTALLLTVTFLSGVQLLFLGIIGEYIGRIYEEVKQRPHYVVEKVVGRS